VKDVLETKTDNLTLKRGGKDGNEDIKWSTETGYLLAFQKDGNLVLSNIKNSMREVILATDTNEKAEKFVALKDGNFALLNFEDKPIWSTKTSGRNRLVLEEDGNLVVYSQSSESSKKLFETGTQGGNISTTEAAKAWKE
jgi:exopolysaccharide biosynthesis protein